MPSCKKERFFARIFDMILHIIIRQRPQRRHGSLCQNRHLGPGPQHHQQRNRSEQGAGGQPLIGFFLFYCFLCLSPSSSSYFFPSVFHFLVSFSSLMMNRAHDSKIWKKHLFFLCTDSPIVKYNCLIEDSLLFFHHKELLPIKAALAVRKKS